LGESVQHLLMVQAARSTVGLAVSCWGHTWLTRGVSVVFPPLVPAHDLTKASPQSSNELQPSSNYVDFCAHFNSKWPDQPLFLPAAPECSVQMWY